MTKPELLGFLHDAFSYYAKSRKNKSSKRHIEIARKEICRLVEKFFELKEKAAKLSDRIDNDDTLNIKDALNEAQDFIDEIQDFGKEENKWTT